MRSGSTVRSRHHVQRRDAVGRGCSAMSFSLEQEFEEFANFGIVLDDQNQRRVRAQRRFAISLADGVRGVQSRLPLRPAELDLDGEDRPLPGLRADAHPMAEHVPKALHDRTDRGQDHGCVRARHCRADGTPRKWPEVPLSGMPTPVSQTSMLSIPPRRRQPSSTLPCLVYFNAFESRLRIICSSRRGSLQTDRPHADHVKRQALAPAHER